MRIFSHPGKPAQSRSGTVDDPSSTPFRLVSIRHALGWTWRIRPPRRLILGLAVLSPALMLMLWPLSPWASLSVFLLAHGLVLAPLFVPRIGWLGPMVREFQTEHRELWLTIDDGPHPDDTMEILDQLDRYQARATFFVHGHRAAAHPSMLSEIAARGHQLGNHTHSHPLAFFWAMPSAYITQEIQYCNQAIAAATGITPSLFRPPAGIKNPALHPVLAQLGMHMVMWTVRALDGVADFDPTKAAARIARRLRPGAIILMHQGITDAQGRSLSAQGIERVLRHATDQGYRFIIPTEAQFR